MILYHGTRSGLIDSILEKGIVPRGTSRGNWIVSSRKDFVYLSIPFVVFYATFQITHDDHFKHESPVVFEIDIKINNKVYPDEDILKYWYREFENRPQPDLPIGLSELFILFEKDIKKDFHGFFEENIKLFQDYTNESLLIGKSCGYQGKISINRINRFVILSEDIENADLVVPPTDDIISLYSRNQGFRKEIDMSIKKYIWKPPLAKEVIYL